MTMLESLLSLAARLAGPPPAARPVAHSRREPEPDAERFFHTADPGFPDLRSLVQPGARVLDVGCGAGRNLCELERQGFRPLGIDVSSYFLEDARKATAAALLRADLLELPLAAGTMDAVVVWQVVCHFDSGSRRAALRGLSLLVAPGGLLVASSCPASAPIEPSALPAGFETIEMRGLDPAPDCPGQRWLLIARRRPQNR